MTGINISGVLCVLFCMMPYLAPAQTDMAERLNTRDLLPTAFPQKDISVADPFDPQAALLQLFPGDTATGIQGERVISWACTACPASSYKDANGELGAGEQASFPPREVSTRLLKVIKVQDSTGSYLFLSFNHNPYDPDGMQTGRFSGGILGIAKFAKAGQSWLLRSVSPAIGAYGAFQQCASPQLVALGDGQYGFLETHMNGGAGGPCWEDYFIIAGINGQYRQVGYVPATARRYTGKGMSAWESRLEAAPGKAAFRDLLIITTGDYFFEPEEPDAFPQNLKALFRDKRPCHFTIITKYAYTAGGGYMPVGAPKIVKR